ncbi:MAG: hypothetical protein KIS67_18680 [Verrucomicrobiae bacterium]|nr:hypothetical protein [Verrucomicrobiae bacterium]
MNVEKMFDTFVKEAGGELVSELLPKSPSFDNADYIFRKRQTEPVIGELKCLTKDLLREGYHDKLNSLYESWMAKGIAKPILGRVTVNSKDLPHECQNELFNLLRTPIKTHVKKANEQIKQTKAHFGLSDAKGLLLLVNDGNYSLESDVVLYLTDRVLGNDHSGINSVIYFTVNMLARMPNVERDVLVWLQARRNGIPSVSHEFLDWLRNGWLTFFNKLAGGPVPTFVGQSSLLLEQIRFMRPPEAGRYYESPQGWKFRCMKINRTEVTWLRFDLPMAGKLLAVEFVQDIKYARHYALITDPTEVKCLDGKYRVMHKPRGK